VFNKESQLAVGYPFSHKQPGWPMGDHYNQLTLDERYQIQALNELDWSARSIATKLARSNKTISRELKRLESGYCARTIQVESMPETSAQTS